MPVTTYPIYDPWWEDRTYTMSTTSNVVWNYWTYTMSTTSNVVWNYWTRSVTTVSTRDLIWADWNDGYAVTYTPMPAPVESAADRQARLDQQQRRREEESARRLASQRLLESAEERARELLTMLLTDEEVRWQVDHPGEILVRGSDGGMYVIEDRGVVHGNIRQVDEHGCVLGRACVQPGMWDNDANARLPIADGLVGQYLAIKHNEAHLRQVANWSSVRACTMPEVPILRAA